jgi:hypothetical protein
MILFIKHRNEDVMAVLCRRPAISLRWPVRAARMIENRGKIA